MKYLLMILKMIVLIVMALILFKSFGVSDWRPWTMETNIPKHFNKALKVGWEPISQGVYEDGTVCCMTLVASERGITIKTPKKREMSEEHKAKLFGAKNVDLDEDFEDEI